MRLIAGLEEDLRSQIKKFSLIFVIAATIIYVAFELTPVPSEVGTLYYRYAETMMDFQMPYSDFAAEYPPFAMLLILIPGFFSFSQLSYQIAFGVEVYLFLLAGLICIHRLAAMYTDNPKFYSNLYIILCIGMFDLILDRYDVFPMVMCLIALYFIKSDRMELAWVMIALGTVTKLYPALMAPLLLIYLCMNGRQKDAVKGIGICLAIGCLSMLPFLIADPNTMLMFLTYHMDRGMQTEALVSSFLMLFGYLGLIDIGYVFNYGSDNIYGPVPDAVAGVILFVMLALIILTYLAYWMVLRNRKDADMLIAFNAASLTVVLLFMLVSKVLSSQYVIWIIPFVIVMAMQMRPEWRVRTIAMYAVTIVLTQINLVVNFALKDAGDPFSLPGILLLIVRNLVLVALLIMTVRMSLHPRDLVPEGEVGGLHHAVEE